jgi:hypothetical protein
MLQCVRCHVWTETIIRLSILGFNLARGKKSFPSPNRPNQFNVPLNFPFEGYQSCVSSVFRREAGNNCAIMGYYAASSGNFLPTFRDNLSVPSLGVNRSHLYRCSAIIYQSHL